MNAMSVKIFLAILFVFVFTGFVSAECIKEGETGLIDLSKRPDNLSYNCCSGLYPINTSIQISEGLCVADQGSGAYKCTSVECGNNICETGENICNCPEDCSKTSSITVVSPNGGESWQVGGDYDIKWNSANVNNVNIYLVFPDGALCFLKTTTASQGHYLFHFLGGYQCPNIDRVPHSQPNNNYKIAIFGDSQDVNDYSDNDFWIVYASIQPSITVISPNGGENWEVGKTYNVIWNTTLYDSSGKIGLQLCDIRGVPGYPGNYLCTEIIPSLLQNSDENYSWTIPPQFLGGYPFDGSKVYRIQGRIWPEGLTRWARDDLSDNTFSISSTNKTNNKTKNKTNNKTNNKTKSSTSTSIDTATNCPNGCVCNGNLVSCPTQSQIIATQVYGEEGTFSEANQISIGKTFSGAVSIKQENVEAISIQKLNVIDSKVYLETSSGVKEIKILPKEASLEASEITTVQEIELKEESAKPVYSISGIKKTKLFFLIPVNVKIETKISAETGHVISTKKPWWSFFAR